MDRKMARLTMFNSVSVDGYFTDQHSDMSFAHRDVQDEEWDKFVSGNAQGDGILVFGRVTYEMMAGFWPTPMAAEMMPEVAEGMNRMQKLVFSRTLKSVAWKNTTLIARDPVGEIRKMKKEGGKDMVILGSGSIVAQLAPHGLIDEYQFVVIPVVLGKGRTMFEGMKEKLPLTLLESRQFRNGNMFLRYQPAA